MTKFGADFVFRGVRWWLMAPRQKSRKGVVGWLLIASLAAVALAAFAQRAAASGLASAVAGLWVSVMSAVLRLIAAIFGAG